MPEWKCGVDAEKFAITAGSSGYLLMREPGKLITAPDMHKLGSQGWTP